MTPGPQQLATIDAKTGHATMFGAPVEELNVMALEFAPDGTLYAVGDANPASPTFNTLYTVDQKTGAFTVGPTSVPADASWTWRSTLAAMLGASMFGLYTIDRKTGTATRSCASSAAAPSWVLATTRSRISYMRPTGTRRLRRCMWSTQRMDLTPMADIGHPRSHGLVALMP